jgi:uncharacterized RDD family membrane protein YckC
MYNEEQSYKRFPKVPLERRVGAFLIDFIAVWLISSLLGFNNFFVQWLVFMLGWLAMRVLLVDKNKGQSLGRWCFDLKILDLRFNVIPDLLSLTKRETIVGLAASLAMFGFQINFRNGLSMLLLNAPLLVDCLSAFVDEELNQALHDRFAQTIIIQSQRGFSLDLRLKKLLAQLRQNMRKY